MKVHIVIQFGDVIGIFTDWHLAERYVRVCQSCYLQWCGAGGAGGALAGKMCGPVVFIVVCSHRYVLLPIIYS